MDFLSLPEPFRIQVLKNIDWKSLKNAKLVSKEMYFTIEANHHLMNKPQVKSLGIYCDKKVDEKEVIRVRFNIFSEDYFLNRRLKVIHFEDLKEYEHFLREFNFSIIDYLHFRISESSDVIRIFNKYYTGGNYIETVVFDDTGEIGKKSANDFSSLISKIKDVGKMYLTLNFPQQSLPDDFIFPKMGSLKELSIEEKSGTRLITSNMITNIIDNNPEMDFLKISSESKSLYMKTSEHIFESKALNMENRCDFTPFEVSFFNLTNFTLSEETFYRELFNKFNNRNNFEEKSDNGNYNFKNTMECLKCRDTHSNFISYNHSSKVVKIILK
uniref:F-box domain-containing protein n=1 Tax=Strongyloides stercoralis TaxID=6248 RepID=A0AAF5D5J5_STRER